MQAAPSHLPGVSRLTSGGRGEEAQLVDRPTRREKRSREEQASEERHASRVRCVVLVCRSPGSTHEGCEAPRGLMGRAPHPSPSLGMRPVSSPLPGKSPAIPPRKPLPRGSRCRIFSA
jgi:hypothetical protein